MRKGFLTLSIALLIAFSGSQAGNRNSYPLPEERGTAGTLAALEKLPVYVRVLHITAHPDDESAGTLTWLSRKFHAQTALFCLTRGEGGQNILGSEKDQELGLVRTGELLEACRYYGTDLYFGKVLDFGFSKSAEETLSKWGHDQTLEDLVLFIRRWRPTVILSRFQGSLSDGHGHHQAAGILSREAFHAAADPNRFPDHLGGGLAPWKTLKFYVSSPALPGQGNPDGSNAGWTVRVPGGDYDPVLGRSYREIAMEGYSRHRSQGSGATYTLPGLSYEYFRLEEPSSGVKENTFFQSLDTSLAAILELAGKERPEVEFLQNDLSSVEQAALKALRSFQVSSPEKSAEAVSHGLAVLRSSIRKVEQSSVSRPVKGILLDALQSKLTDFQKALSSVLGTYFITRTEDVSGVPGEKQAVTVYFYNRGSEAVSFKDINLLGPGNIVPASANPPFGEIAPGGSAVYRYSLEISPDANSTEPFWYLESIGDGRYKIKSTTNEFAPFAGPEISAEASYLYRNVEAAIRAPAEAQAGDPIRGSDFIDFQVVPALSVTVEPDFQIATAAASGSYTFRVSVLNNHRGEALGTLKLESAAGWRIQPAGAPFRLSRKGESFTASFVVRIPAGTKPGNYPVEAVAAWNGRQFRRGFHTISYPENWTRNFYVPARSGIVTFDVKIASNLTVGYIPGAGDNVPDALKQLGINVQTLAGSDLAFGDLSRFSAIVTGIRAYNVNEELRANNRRLLEYVDRGGTLIVQYVRPMERPTRGSAGSSFIYGPYPMSVSDSERITVEDSPVRILEPSSPVFTRPNRITAADFEGWVQERGLYFMRDWDSRFTALVSGNDPGEKPTNGGMLYARYGKGHYIYTGYSWFRQLPAGVPGAFRLFANMLSLGQTSAKK